MLHVTIECKADSFDSVNRIQNSCLSQNQAETVKNNICTIEHEGKEDKARVGSLQGIHRS